MELEEPSLDEVLIDELLSGIDGSDMMKIFQALLRERFAV